MTTVTQVPRTSINIQVTGPGVTGILTPTGAPITVSTSGTTSSGSLNRLDSLDDVVEIGPQEGDVPTYDALTDKYVVGPINLDGGTF